MSYGVMRFSEKLEIWIGKRGLTQGTLAKQVGLSPSAISDMTAAKRRPYMDQGLKLAKALGLSLDFLADDDLDYPAEAGSDMTDDERFVLQLIRDLGLGRAEAVKRLASVVVVEAETGGKVQPVRTLRPVARQDLSEMAQREAAEARGQEKEHEKRRLGFELESDCEATGGRDLNPFPRRRG